MADYNYPYTDFHRLNLDWLIEYVQKCTAGNLTKDDIVQALGDATDKVISQKAITDILNARREEVQTELNAKFDKFMIAQTTGNSDNKVMSQKAVTDAIADVITHITKTFVSIYKDGSGWSATKEYSEVINSLSEINWKYYYYPGSIAEGGYCEIFPAARTNTSISFTGISDYQVVGENRVTLLLPVRVIWSSSGAISVINRTIGVDDVQIGNKSSTTIAPSSRYLNDNFDKGIHTGAFNLTNDSNRIIQMTGGALSTANTISFTINTDFDDITSGKVHLQFIIGAALTTNTNIPIYNGINRITVRRSVEGVNGWEIINCSEKGMYGQYVKLNTSISASAATYNNWVFNFTPAPPTSAAITVSGGYSY